MLCMILGGIQWCWLRIFTCSCYNGRCQAITLTHWGRVTHICVAYLTIIASDNGLSPSRRQALIWTNAGILLIGHLGINFNEILIEFNTFSFKKMLLKMASAKWRLFRLGPQCVNKYWIQPMAGFELGTCINFSILNRLSSMFRRKTTCRPFYSGVSVLNPGRQNSFWCWNRNIPGEIG